MTDEHRSKIKMTVLLNHLGDHAAGKREMSATQVQAAQILLRKVMPDLAAIEHSGEVTQTYIVSPKLPNEEWEEKYVTKHLDS